MTNLEKGIARLKAQGVMENPFINQLKKGNKTLFIGGIGYIIDEQPNNEEHCYIREKIAELEKGGNIVYAVLLYAIDDMKCYAYCLCTDEDKNTPYHDGEYYEAFAYVDNKIFEDFSEYGYITTCGKVGGLAIAF